MIIRDYHKGFLLSPTVSTHDNFVSPDVIYKIPCYILFITSRRMTKYLCTQRRLWSDWASDSLIRVFAVRMKKHWVLNYYLLSSQWRLWSDCEYVQTARSESSLGAQVILLVLSCTSSNDTHLYQNRNYVLKKCVTSHHVIWIMSD